MENTILIKTRFNIKASEIDDVTGAINMKAAQLFEKRCHENSYVMEIINIIKRGPAVSFPYSTEGLMTVDVMLEARVKRYTKGDIIPLTKISVNPTGMILGNTPGLYITLDKVDQIMHGAKSGDMYPVKVKKATYPKYDTNILVTGKRYTRPTHTTLYVISEVDPLSTALTDEIEYYISEIKRLSIKISSADKKVVGFLDDILFYKNNVEFRNAIHLEELYTNYSKLDTETVLVKYPTMINRNTEILSYNINAPDFNKDVQNQRISMSYKACKKILKASVVVIKLLRYQLSILGMISGILTEYPTMEEIKTNNNAWSVIQQQKDM